MVGLILLQIFGHALKQTCFYLVELCTQLHFSRPVYSFKYIHIPRNFKGFLKKQLNMQKCISVILKLLVNLASQWFQFYHYLNRLISGLLHST